MNEMVKVSALLPARGRMTRINGICETHGAADALALDGRPWYCPECLAATQKADYAAQWARERGESLHKIADFPPRYRGQKFTSSSDKHKAVRSIAASFRDFVMLERRWAALILMGDVGTGKTQLACEFGESYIGRLSRSVRYVTAKGMIGEIQACYGREGKSEDAEIERFVQYDMLILDEIDAIPSKDNAALLLTEIINRRYGANKPMIVITNQPFDSLAQFVGDRVHDRLRENAFVCDFDWPSFRRME